MAVVREISVEHCRKVIITDNPYSHLSEEEIAERNRHIKEHFELLARKTAEKNQTA